MLLVKSADVVEYNVIQYVQYFKPLTPTTHIVYPPTYTTLTTHPPHNIVYPPTHYT